MAFNDSVSQGDILVVDDLADNLRVLSDTLSSKGHRVRAVRNGPMALIGAKAAPPDVILLDIRMPSMDGFEVCQRLKADQATQHIPVIFLSALDEAFEKARAFEAGGVDYITKPFQTVEVQARVSHQLTIRQLRRQVAAQKEQLEQLESLIKTLSGQTGFTEPTLAMATQAVDVIRAYADCREQNPALSTEQTLQLHDLRRCEQAILQALISLGD